MERGRRWKRPPYKTVGLVTIVVMGLVGLALYSQFRGDLTPKAKSTTVAARAGLVMDENSGQLRLS